MPYKDPAEMAEARRRYERKNPGRSAKNRVRRYQAVNALKADGKCADCGREDAPDLMDYHHEGEKKDGVAALIRTASTLEIILDEIKLCVLLCCRCHRIRHRKASEPDIVPKAGWTGDRSSLAS